MNADRTDNKPNAAQTAEMICVAAIAGAFGVKGEVKLRSFTEVEVDCLGYGPLMNLDGQVVLSPNSWRKAGKFLAIKAPEITTREQAEAMKSVKLYVFAANLPALDEDEFYYRDLVGLQVKTASGQNAGKVVAVHEFGAGDMLEIKPKDAKSYYHPFTKDAVPKVDIKAGRVIIVPQISDPARQDDEGQGEEE